MSGHSPLTSLPLTSEAFRSVAGRYATGVTVVTTAGAGTVHGITVNAFTSVSLEPLLLLVSIERRARMHGLLEHTGVFAVSILSAGDEQLSRRFSVPGREEGEAEFAELDCAPAPVSGSPVLRAAMGWFDCRITDAHVAGDHTLFIGEVTAMGLPDPDAEPLVFFRGGYQRL